ncbi:MAG: hypothetical protein JO283_16815 [Bradyrhizobium sp.]|nr:hypothetical protein [Bradyrhizobium sp.]
MIRAPAADVAKDLSASPLRRAFFVNGEIMRDIVSILKSDEGKFDIGSTGIQHPGRMELGN